MLNFESVRMVMEPFLSSNFLLVESLLRFYMFYGKALQIECPTWSSEYMHLDHVAEEI